EGLDRGRRRVADRGGTGQPILYRVSDTRDPGAHQSRCGRARNDSELGGRRAGEIRGTASGGSDMSSVQAPFATIEEAIEDLRQGKMVVVVDDENRENEGDLTIAAQFVTPETINFMRKEGGGLI